MDEIEKGRKTAIMEKLSEKDQQLKDAMEKKEREIEIKKELENLKRIDREEEVKRISKVQEYEKEKMLEKMKIGDKKLKEVRSEKEELMERRKLMRQKADFQRQQLVQSVEKMKYKGKFDFDKLKSLGYDRGNDGNHIF